MWWVESVDKAGANPDLDLLSSLTLLLFCLIIMLAVAAPLKLHLVLGLSVSGVGWDSGLQTNNLVTPTSVELGCDKKYSCYGSGSYSGRIFRFGSYPLQRVTYGGVLGTA